ncbi:MAG: orotidine-5'-phosphate decarboxylase [Pseudohongiellaceae bacterium]
MNDKPIIVAMDFNAEAPALALVEQLDSAQCRLKIGKELFTACGPALVRKVQDQGFEVFLDLKFHDIPNTVAGACRAAADLGVWMVNVHASGGEAMLQQAAQAVASQGAQRPLLVAVTVLTSMSRQDLVQVGVDEEPQAQVRRLAALTHSAGLDGVVCSAAETVMLRQQLPPDFCLVTPGIRRPEDASNDQKRVVGPAEAIRNGSNYLVVGRPITQATDPAAALAQFNSSLAGL